MDEFEILRDSIGITAELMLMFWQAAINAGADEETAYYLTTIYLDAIMNKCE